MSKMDDYERAKRVANAMAAGEFGARQEYGNAVNAYIYHAEMKNEERVDVGDHLLRAIDSLADVIKARAVKYARDAEADALAEAREEARQLLNDTSPAEAL